MATSATNGHLHCETELRVLPQAVTYIVRNYDGFIVRIHLSTHTSIQIKQESLNILQDWAAALNRGIFDLVSGQSSGGNYSFG